MAIMKNSCAGSRSGARLIVFALSISSIWITGCATSGYHKSDATARSLQYASWEVTAESRALDLTVRNLNELINRPGADLKPQFRRFSGALDRLIKEAARNDRADVAIARKSSEYFETWDKELAAMNYEVVRQRSQARKAEVTNDFATVHQRYLDAQAVMQPLLSYLEDIRKAVSADLTQRGLEAMKPIAAHADENAAKVQVALSRLSDELSASGRRFSSFVFQTTPRAGTNSGPQ